MMALTCHRSWSKSNMENERLLEGVSGKRNATKT